ncbi:hypothetical protein CAEBREN_11962 [Caenorhabditis brenneri]|uniref:Uncharacterized protein n=1 Tax=Caenorhabditis brenneri TaxID=135651 RepID=G0N4C5_CAEBE|nr:hypothetical protein CAEBREN_11962 [Caenorhabditis brenneri]
MKLHITNSLSPFLSILALLAFFSHVQATFDHPERTLEVLRGVVRNQQSAIWIRFNLTCPRTHFCMIAYVKDTDAIFGRDDDFRFVPIKCTPTNVLLHEEFVLFSGILTEIGNFDPHVEIIDDCVAPGEMTTRSFVLPDLGRGGAVRAQDIHAELGRVGRCKDRSGCIPSYHTEKGKRFGRMKDQFINDQEYTDTSFWYQGPNKNGIVTGIHRLFEKKCTELRKDGEGTQSLYDVPCPTQEPVTLATTEIARELPTDPMHTQDVDYLLNLYNGTKSETIQIDSEASNSTFAASENATVV